MAEPGCTDTADAPGRRPLPVLLGRLASRFIGEFERRLAAQEFCALSLAHSANVLRFVRDEPVRAGNLAALSGVTKQAMSQQLAHLERNGYVNLDPDPCDQRARIVVLTPRGRQAQARVDELFTEIESDWAGTLGASDAAALRRILESGLEKL